MVEQELLQLKELIRQRIGQLQEQLDQIGSVSDKHKEQSDDQAASLDITINSAVERKLKASTQAELVRLRKKLQWLETDEAGFCDGCGGDLPFARLKASLGTRLCVTCAENQGE